MTGPALPTAAVLAFTYRAGRFLVHMSSEASGDVSGLAPDETLSVRSEAFLQLESLAAGTTLRVAGQLDSLVVTPSRLPQAGSGYTRLLLPLRFSALLRVDGHATLHAGADSSGSCWSEARTVLDPLHAMFPGIPSPLREGSRWRDSVEIQTCRLGIAVQVREVRDLVVERIDSRDGSLLGQVGYTAVTAASGTRSSRGASVTYAGTGESRGRLVLDATAGVVRRDSSEGTYLLILRVDGSERILTQRGRRVIDLAPRN